MKKQIDTSHISNELKGRSLHFTRPPAPPPVEPRPEEAPNPGAPMQDELRVEPIVSLETKKQVSEETIFQGNNGEKKQVSKETKNQRNKSLKRYSTYLTEESILEMQRIALETRRKDYDIFQEAVDKYIKRHTGRE